ncbi:MAG: hypothetical protein JW955_08320 [Sedimentisphaerales bacterium]|nr:hypothetical protein [Sedimentisphaerales bacterium]
MKTGALVSCGVAIAGMLCLLVLADTPAAQDIKWDHEVESAVLEKNALAAIGTKAAPAWKQAQMLWPSSQDIASHSVASTPDVRANLNGWLKRVFREGALPDSAAEHAIAMRRWGLYRAESEQKNRVDVFVIRFKTTRHSVQLQDFNHVIVVTVADEDRADDAAKELKPFVQTMAQQYLSTPLVPDPSKDLFEYGAGETDTGNRITHFVWAPPSTVSRDEEGKKCISMETAAQLGTYHIEAETDGRFVRFVIRKYLGGTGDPSPEADRFAPRAADDATEPSRK